MRCFNIFNLPLGRSTAYPCEPPAFEALSYRGLLPGRSLFLRDDDSDPSARGAAEVIDPAGERVIRRIDGAEGHLIVIHGVGGIFLSQIDLHTGIQRIGGIAAHGADGAEAVQRHGL